MQWMHPTFRTLATAALSAAAVAACTENGATDPEELRFGQIGETRIVMETPLELGSGSLRQELRWGSDGVWLLTETVSYDGGIGDVDQTVMNGNRELSAGIYASWIIQVNEQAGLNLFVEELDPFLDPTCADLRSRMTLTIRDEPKGREASWTRCVQGPLRSLTPVGAGPDPAASRVANAAVLVRDRTLGEGFTSSFAGTIPFATIDRGDDSGAPLTGPRVIHDPSEWVTFWAEHSRSQGPAPQVDFERDLVLVGAVGPRQEAGDSVEIARILAVAEGTVVEIEERVPGNFCAPAEKLHTPYHIVRVPIFELPLIPADVRVERVPCG